MRQDRYSMLIKINKNHEELGGNLEPEKHNEDSNFIGLRVISVVRLQFQQNN